MMLEGGRRRPQRPLQERPLQGARAELQVRRREPSGALRQADPRDGGVLEGADRVPLRRGRRRGHRDQLYKNRSTGKTYSQ